jgi:flagellar hook-basal body complex protein FliE
MSSLTIGHIPLGGAGGLRPADASGAGATAPGEAFLDRLEAAVDQINGQQVEADRQVEDFVTGGDVPVHQLMIELAKADTSMRLMTAVTTKAIQAYQEIARMQI